MGEDQWSPNIGDDGEGFVAISHKIRYPEMPDTLTLSHFVDSLLQCYNIALAFNTMAYDVSTAERYMSESDFGLEQADALDSINVSGISERDIREALLSASKTAAVWIRKSKEPNSQENPDVDRFYEAYNRIQLPLSKTIYPMRSLSLKQSLRSIQRFTPKHWLTPLHSVGSC